ncbi:hypothetical protein ASPVEDRAFT_36037 [Aspergillus versicolor CBS 583.65]|uniref:Uncharacterized protein n=1 Tax=Aspergillus versicolor CBS 583.65 TaxID=1036611 RepID=A0A1L9P551_ASPVE|nr:uncharacterized protein ASPVEDRAFT_36037 [Aspergillus versicolor CBS 583.65]OJI96640.1 hypothetical protein ASPVEDRAFT_36037 [Aspergillus versicolor CBS 583.65]
MSVSEIEDILFFEDADTLAFIETPSYKPAWILRPSCAQSIGHRIHSWKLLATGSAVLRQLFDPKVQERNIKNRGGLPEGIRYIIDLTPPSTEDDAVLHLTELSCPLGIRTWAAARDRWDLPPQCVSGVDIHSSDGDGDDKNHSGYPAEYSPARHRAGIIHVLQVLEGLNPKLDTPCKLWTFFAVAKLYEISALRDIRTRVTLWLYEGENKLFIQLHPEIAYRIAKGIRCDYLLQDAFCVLVGEEALLLLRNSGTPIPKQQQTTTVHGRPREMLDDDDVQRVQYAGESFLGSIIEKFVQLIGDDMHWLKNILEFRRVFYSPHGPPEEEVVNDLIATLKDWVRATIFMVLSLDTTVWMSSKYRLELSGDYPTSDYLNVYSSMPFMAHIMTRTFWVILSERKLNEIDGEKDIGPSRDRSLARLGGYMGAFRDQHNALVRYVTVAELSRKAHAFNCLFNSLAAQPNDHTAQHDGKLFMPERYFSLSKFVSQVQGYISGFAREMIAPRRPVMSYDLTDTLTLLTESEYRYLPLWAGGCDDGSGGVYADQIPLAETDGFSAPGPSIHTGSAAPSTAPSIMSLLESTLHGASHRATEGFASEVVSINSEVVSETGNAIVADPSDFKKVDDELSFALDSSADDVDDVFFDSDSDSDDTVVIDHADISDFSELEEMKLDEGKVQDIPKRETRAAV